MISRRKVLAASVAGLASAPLLAHARVPRIYMILFRGETGAEKGFRDYFRSNGIAAEFIVRDVALDVSKIPALIEEARALEVDLIYTWGTSVTLAVAGRQDAVDPRRHVTDIPIVFTIVASPEGAGLVDARSSSGRNLTGTSHVVPTDLQLTAMRAYRKFERLGIVYNPVEQNSLQILAELRASARRDRFALIERPVPLDQKGQPQPGLLPELVADLTRERVDLLYMGPDSFLSANRKLFTEAALAQRLPTFCATEIGLRDGKALFGLVSGYENVGRLTAFKAAEIILKKIPPHAIPIETLARFSYLVNMPVARALQMYPPLKVLNFAELLK